MKVRKTYISAIIVFLLIVAWVGSGIIEREYFGKAAADSEKPLSSEDENHVNKSKKLTKVRYKLSKAAFRQQTLSIRGRSEAKRRVVIKSETSGKVIKVHVKKGDRVIKGDILCELEIGARFANLSQSKASLAQAKLDFEVTDKLASEGHLAKNRKAVMQAKLDAAKAQVVLAELEIDRTKIKVPFNGVIEDEPAILGELLQPGAKCATLAELNPIIVFGNISERQVNHINVGDMAEVEMIGNRKLSGKISYISSVAESSTRTFRVEVELNNPNWDIKTGLSSNIKIYTQKMAAHQFSSAILSLADNGKIGIKVLDENNKVVFKEVSIIGDVKGSGVLASGLDKQEKIITVGQEYVDEGQIVEAILEK